MNLKNIGIINSSNEISCEDLKFYRIYISNRYLFKNIYYILFRRECVFNEPKKNSYSPYVYLNKKDFNDLKIFSRKMKLFKLNNKNPKIKKDSIQCKEITNKNERCKLHNIENSYYCLQHYLLKIKNNNYD